MCVKIMSAHNVHYIGNLQQELVRCVVVTPTYLLYPANTVCLFVEND